MGGMEMEVMETRCDEQQLLEQKCLARAGGGCVAEALRPPLCPSSDACWEDKCQMQSGRIMPSGAYIVHSHVYTAGTPEAVLPVVVPTLVTIKGCDCSSTSFPKPH